MDWWIKLKEMIRGKDDSSLGRVADRKDPRLPSFIMALCSVSDESAFSVEITSLSVSGMKVNSPRRLRTNSDLHLRVPVGLNFEDRDTNEYISFTARTVWSQRRPTGFESGVRYLEEENDKRDRWIQLVLQTYGVSLGDDRRRGDMVRYRVTLPVVLKRSDQSEVRAEVRDISLGGLQIALDGTRLQTMERFEIRFPQHDLTLNATVLHGRVEGTPSLYGLAFDELDEKTRGALVDMVRALSRQAVAVRAKEPVVDDDESETASTP